jgi:hypothetical protein
MNVQAAIEKVIGVRRVEPLRLGIGFCDADGLGKTGTVG